jgi:4-amino-4-deoxy-L-arabinose transferase-like glycosyltransferase
VWGISFGLPELFHPDEPAYVLQALAVGRGLPSGLTFANPPLFKYLLLAEYVVTYVAERVLGGSHSPAEFVEQFRADPSLLYLIARLTSAVLGACTALVTGALAASVASRRAGLLAGALAAVVYLLVRDGHFGVDDTLVTLLVTLGLVACVRVYRFGRRRDYVAAGILAGLAFTAKYDGIALLAPLLLAHFAPRRRGRAVHDLLLALVACALAALLTFPSLVTEPGRVLNDIYVHLYVESTGGYDGLDPSGGYVFYARTLLIGLGWPLVVVAAAGTALSVIRRDFASLVVASLPVAMLAVLGSQQLYFARFALPALPALIVLASLALDGLIVRQAVIGWAAFVLVALPTLADTIRFDTLMTRTDTRTLARQWLETSLPAEATFAVDAPPLGPNVPSARLADDALYELSPVEYRAHGVDYLVVSSFVSDARAVDPAREARREAFNAALGSQATLVAQFRPYAGDTAPPFVYDQIYGPYTDLDLLERPGPTVTVYRLTR